MFDVTVKTSSVGMGVFATRDFKKGAIILLFSGSRFRKEELPVPYHKVDDHYMQIGRNLYIGPSGDFDDYINHSCDPNCGVYFQDNIKLVAIKDIRSNEEINWDYSTTMDEDDWEMACKCMSNKCRRVIRDFKYLPKKTQKRYLNLNIVPDYIRIDPPKVLRGWQNL